MTRAFPFLPVRSIVSSCRAPQVQFGRKLRIVVGRAPGHTRRMNTNTMAAETPPARAGHHILEQLNDAARWNAVVAHDRTSDGLFVYAVRSTGVYCRPSCPSRRPRRDRVAFFDTSAE